MKLVILAVFAVVAVAVAAPQNKPAPEIINILRSAFDQQPDGQYNYNFETENGIKRDETGELKQVVDEDNKPQDVVVVRGSYSYPGEDGKPIVVTYFADETGYHAESDIIPKAQR